MSKKSNKSNKSISIEMLEGKLSSNRLRWKEYVYFHEVYFHPEEKKWNFRVFRVPVRGEKEYKKVKKMIVCHRVRYYASYSEAMQFCERWLRDNQVKSTLSRSDEIDCISPKGEVG